VPFTYLLVFHKQVCNESFKQPPALLDMKRVPLTFRAMHDTVKPTATRSTFEQQRMSSAVETINQGRCHSSSCHRSVGVFDTNRRDGTLAFVRMWRLFDVCSHPCVALACSCFRVSRFLYQLMLPAHSCQLTRKATQAMIAFGNWPRFLLLSISLSRPW
jgi:hypothetical protein